MKKTILLILILIFTALLTGCSRGGEAMYIEVYDRNLEHVTNITKVKYDITRRTFDFDTSAFEGVSENEVELGYIFTLNSATGELVYSGFMESIKQNGKLVTFKGGDFKKIFDTEVVLDYATVLGLSPKVLGEIFHDVVIALDNDLAGAVPVDFTIPNPNDPVDWMANYDSQHIIINAINFLKPYLAYHQYYISSYFDRVEKRIKVEIKKNNTQIDIKLEDFIHETTKTNPTINKATALLKFDNVEPNTKMWISSSEDYWNRVKNKGESIQMFAEPLEEADDYDFGYALKITYRETGMPEDTVVYYQVSNKAVERPADLPRTTYYLGNDNQIYEGEIPEELMILPVKGKIFEDAFFQKSQFNAISELVNSRYNNNITITNTRSPIDLSELELYTMVKVYDKNDAEVEMPVSEIVLNNQGLTVKLGFKKTLFTEIVKSENKEAIKSTNSGGSGATTIITEEGIVFQDTEPVDAKDGTFWFSTIEIIEIDD